MSSYNVSAKPSCRTGQQEGGGECIPSSIPPPTIHLSWPVVLKNVKSLGYGLRLLKPWSKIKELSASFKQIQVGQRLNFNTSLSGKGIKTLPICHPQISHSIGQIWRKISKVYLGSMSRDAHSCTHWLRPRKSLPPPAFGLVLRGRYWSAKIDDISL